MKRIFEISKTELKKYLDQGMSYKEIAKIIGCSHWTIGTRVREYGLKSLSTSLGRLGKKNPVFNPGVREKISSSISKKYKNGTKMGFQLIKQLSYGKRYPCEKCEGCGNTKNLKVHHIDGNTSNHLITNLECLCGSCHVSKHYQPYLRLKTLYHFDSAHSLPGFPPCDRKHGHTFKLAVTIGGRLNKQGMVKPFGEIKKIVEENIIQKLDHFDLNDRFVFPSAENLLDWIFRSLNKKIKGLKEVELWETETCSVSVNDKTYLSLLGE